MKTGIIAILTAVLVACAPRTESLQSGDLIFCGVPSEGDEGTAAGAIAASVGHGNVNIIHVAIVEVADDTVWVIDATMKRGVDRHPLDTLIRDFTGADGQKPILLVKRLKEGFSPQFIDNAKRFLGQPYDYWFQPDNGRQYCSELVWESYRRPDGTPLFDSYPMNFKGPDGTYPAYWVQLFEELGEPIPQDAPGTNPQDMAEADILREVRLPAIAQDPAQKDEAILREWIKTISSDAFGGRKPMTPYEDITVDYLERQLAGLGLQPAFGGSWVQPFRMVAVTCRPAGGKIVAEGPRKVELGYPDDLIVWTARAGEKVVIPEAEYVFCGFGIQAPEYGWNDYEGVDVRGKIVIAMVNDPGYYDATLFRGRNMTYYGRWLYKFEEALRQGAAGCLVLHNTEAASYGWHVCVNGHLEGNLALYDPETGNAGELAMKGWLHEDGCRKLFRAAGMDLDEILAAAKRPGFKAIPLQMRSRVEMDVHAEIQETRNVGAILPGTDLKDEVVVLCGHWDHLGFGQPDETGDEIYNGATDNASGMAGVLLAARKFLALPQPTRRSILFLFPSSEESGLFGSQYYCEHPALPMKKTVACLNFESIGPAPLTRDIVILGGGESSLDDYFVAAASAQGREIFFDDDNSDGWFFRSDHYNFVKKGVPAVVVENGLHPLDPRDAGKYPMESWYHKPCDEYRDDWDLTGTLANINLMYDVGLSLANTDARP
ncbi:MAG: M28 family peptidase [Bacteroidales bacterium]|nr:M28 family peptidase [Bacteroidales bacterium]